MKAYTKIILIAGLFLSVTSCSDFLEELPTRGTDEPVQRLEQLVALLDAPTFTERFRFTCLVGTDNFELPRDLWRAFPASWGPAALPFYTFQVEGVATRPSDMFWNDLYAEMFRANLILENVDYVSGDADLRAQVRAEAYFLRAYLNFTLANKYILPYHPDNHNELGLPRKISTSPEEDFSRMTLRETWDLIEEDLERALMVRGSSPNTTHRANNRATVNALVSRVMLHKGDWDRVITASEYALNNSGIVQLKDYAVLGYAGNIGIFANPPDTIGWSEVRDWSTPQFFNWQEFFYVRVSFFNVGRLVASPSLLASFNREHDLRYRWFFQNTTRDWGTTEFRDRDDIRIFTFGFSNLSFMPAGISIQEVMLNKAEALVRRSSPDVGAAMALVNELRAHRMAPHPERTLTAASPDEALLYVLAERRRELPFTHRWGDIRRFAFTPTTIDDVVVTREFYEVRPDGTVNTSVIKTYTLPLRSRRYAVPINETEIINSRGRLVQNIYY